MKHVVRDAVFDFTVVAACRASLAIAAVIHTSGLSHLVCVCVLESKSSAQQGSVTHVCGLQYQGRHARFNNHLQGEFANVTLDNNKADISRSHLFIPSVLRPFMSYFLSPSVCRATSNNKVKEMVLLELSYVNSNLQLLMGQLEGLNSSVEVYQNTQ